MYAQMPSFTYNTLKRNYVGYTHKKNSSYLLTDEEELEVPEKSIAWYNTIDIFKTLIVNRRKNTYMLWLFT